MERLIKCIEENAEKENPAGKRMLSSDCGVYPVKKIFEYDDLALNTGNTQSQNNAMKPDDPRQQNETGGAVSPGLKGVMQHDSETKFQKTGCPV